VIAGDPNVQSVELVAAALGELCEELVLVGGCAAWQTLSVLCCGQFGRNFLIYF
jgi:hypothetical protein